MGNVLSIAFVFALLCQRQKAGTVVYLCFLPFSFFRIHKKGFLKMSLLEITGLTHSFGENLLYKNAGFTLNKGEHIGIVGQNGTGKSTLIKICTEQIIPDSGRVIWQPNITIGYLDQYAEIDHTLTMKEFLKSAFAKLFEIETQVMQLYEKAADGDMKNLELAAYYQEQLETHDFYSIYTCDRARCKWAGAACDWS